MNEVILTSPMMQFKVTSANTNWDVFSDTKIANELMTKYGLDSAKIAANRCFMSVTILPDTATSVIVNGSEFDCSDFYSSGGYSPIKSLLIKDASVSLLVILGIN